LDFWNKCTEKLENRLTQEDFNTWIRPLKGSLVDNTLELVAPNDFILNYVEKNLSTEITGLVKQQSKKDISLVFKTLTKETFVDKYKKNNQNDNSKLVQSYVFDSFVEGKSNHLALAAAKQVAPKGTTTHYLYMVVLVWVKHTLCMRLAMKFFKTVLIKGLFMCIQKNLFQIWLKPFNWVQ
jgi:chromosomal replication initiation ATPase DnaA